VPRVLPLDVWRTRLENRGHRITEPERTTLTGFTLWPDLDTIIVVAVEPDETQRPRSGQRYFLCAPEPEQVFRVASCPEPSRNRWLELVSQQPAGYWQDFLAGPGSWVLSRLARFDEVVAWSDNGLEWPMLDNSTHRFWGVEIPAEAAPLFCAPDRSEKQGLVTFRTDDERFADAVAACLLFASVALRDCYLADLSGAEVYLAHHHDKVMVSVPGAGAREELLAGLRKAPWLFTDVSGYTAPSDDELQWDDTGL
jgi:hypothetical protein